MKLEINELYHNFVIKIVIFAVFLYKNQIRKDDLYKSSIFSFTKKRLPWKINLKIDTGERMEKDLERDLIIDEILNNIESDYLTFVTVSFTTPLKKVVMVIDITDESKYEKYLYS